MGAGGRGQLFVSLEHSDKLTCSVKSIDEGPSMQVPQSEAVGWIVLDVYCLNERENQLGLFQLVEDIVKEHLGLECPVTVGMLNPKARQLNACFLFVLHDLSARLFGAGADSRLSGVWDPEGTS